MRSGTELAQGFLATLNLNREIIVQKQIIVASLLAAFSALPSIAMAQAAPVAPASPYTVTGNVALASEYIYRGIGQTNRKAAIQGGFDLAHSSGFYVGNWNSNISWLSDFGAGAVSSGIEMDFYGGYKGAVGDLSYDVGALYYYYPGTYPAGFVSANTTELYGALTYGPVTAKYSQSTGNLFGYANSHGSGYFDLTAAFDLGSGYGFQAHYGHQSVKNFGAASYADYKLAITKDISGYVVTAAAIGTNAKGGVGQPYQNAFAKDLGSSRLVLSLGKTF
jgi:uncharacterized protein (TIGR02001 family)